MGKRGVVIVPPMPVIGVAGVASVPLMAAVAAALLIVAMRLRSVVPSIAKLPLSPERVVGLIWSVEPSVPIATSRAKSVLTSLRSRLGRLKGAVYWPEKSGTAVASGAPPLTRLPLASLAKIWTMTWALAAGGWAVPVTVMGVGWTMETAP